MARVENGTRTLVRANGGNDEEKGVAKANRVGKEVSAASTQYQHLEKRKEEKRRQERISRKKGREKKGSEVFQVW